jgi:hypothetical protein
MVFSSHSDGVPFRDEPHSKIGALPFERKWEELGLRTSVFGPMLRAV